MKTHIEYFYDWENNTPNNIFLKQPFGSTWHTLTYREAGVEARKMVTALNGMGLEKGDHIGILSKNCYHWVLADLAISIGGFVSVPFYASLPKARLQEVIQKSDIKLLFVGKLDHWGDKDSVLSSDLKVIKFPHYEGNATINVGLSWNDLIKRNKPFNKEPIPDFDDTWTIVFTSGTTGSPKGVVLNYRNIAILFKNEVDHNTLGFFDMERHSFFSFLPLNHVGERLIIEGAAFFTGGSISFAENIDTFMKNLQDIQPSVFFAVPRIWNIFQSGILAKISQKRLDVLLSLPLINRLIKKRIKQSLGLLKAEAIVTGAAITPSHLKKWYRKFDINIREVFGASEACGGVTITPIGEIMDEGVGKPVTGVEFKIDSNTGEIIYKCDQLMVGYYKDPVRTSEVLKDGWYYSGDKGYFDEENNLYVIGRLNDEFKTEKGIYITPNPIESMVLKSDLIEQTCVVGLASPQPLALINLSEIGIKLSKEEIIVRFQELIDIVNKDLANNSKIASIVITKEIWNEENNMLTPTLKVRRSIIDEKYMSFYTKWYNLDEPVIWEL